MIHKGTECDWCIGQPKRHHSEFLGPISCDVRYLQFIPHLDLHLVVLTPQVQQGQDLCTTESVKELINIGYKIFVLHCDLVQHLLVNTWSQ